MQDYYSLEIQQKFINKIYHDFKIGIFNHSDEELIKLIKSLKFVPPVSNGTFFGYTVSDDTFDSLKKISFYFEQNRKSIGKNMAFYIYFNELFLNNKVTKPLMDFMLNKNIVIQTVPIFDFSLIEKQIKLLQNNFDLKELYYVYDFKLEPEQNFILAQKMLNELSTKLSDISELIKLENKKSIGKGILSIALEPGNPTEDNASYASLNNTIYIYHKVNSNLIHEYVHFLDKTNVVTLLFHKNSQQLFEEYVLNSRELFYFSCETFDLIKNIEKHSKFDIQTSIFKKQILKHDFNDFIYNTFYYKKNEEANARSLNNNIISWLTRSNLNSKELMIDIENAINKRPIDKNKYIGPINLVFQYIDIYHKNNEKNDNNYIKMSKNLDTHNNQIYYARLKEVLARSIEGKYNGYQFKELSNKLTTPKISDKNYEKLIEILKDWSDNIDKNLNQSSLSSKIKEINLKLRGNEEQIKKIKRMF